MSVDYAAGLSHYDDLGVCGLDEVVDEPEIVREKVRQLASWLRHFDGSCLVHVGAGLSTAAGIPDFRGKRGVWTKLQQQQRQEVKTLPASSSSLSQQTDKKPKLEVEDLKEEEEVTNIRPFNETVPTKSHLALRELCQKGFIKHIVSQNVDGLFLKANLPRKFISELHGNFYLDECTKCRSRFIRGSASETMRLQKSSVKCPRIDVNCRGHLRDTILDWESPIPYNELRVAEKESKRNRLHICIGTSMQLRPSKDLVCDPTRRTAAKKSKTDSSKLVIINLQPIQLDKKANLVINYYADDVMQQLADELNIVIPSYDCETDPTKDPTKVGSMWKRNDVALEEHV